jgi:hypothetical protein
VSNEALFSAASFLPFGTLMCEDVVALADGSTRDEVPLGHPEHIARVFDANLTAQYLNPMAR